MRPGASLVSGAEEGAELHQARTATAQAGGLPHRGSSRGMGCQPLIGCRSPCCTAEQGFSQGSTRSRCWCRTALQTTESSRSSARLHRLPGASGACPEGQAASWRPRAERRHVGSQTRRPPRAPARTPLTLLAALKDIQTGAVVAGVPGVAVLGFVGVRVWVILCAALGGAGGGAPLARSRGVRVADDCAGTGGWMPPGPQQL